MLADPRMESGARPPSSTHVGWQCELHALGDQIRRLLRHLQQRAEMAQGPEFGLDDLALVDQVAQIEPRLGVFHRAGDRSLRREHGRLAELVEPGFGQRLRPGLRQRVVARAVGVFAQDRATPVERAAQQQAALGHQLLVLDRPQQHELPVEQRADDHRRQRRHEERKQHGGAALRAPAPIGGLAPFRSCTVRVPACTRRIAGLRGCRHAPTSSTRRNVLPSPRSMVTSTPAGTALAAAAASPAGSWATLGSTQPPFGDHVRT